jgi:type II secretory pathway component GspD/PulD (secretin)
VTRTIRLMTVAVLLAFATTGVHAQEGVGGGQPGPPAQPVPPPQGPSRSLVPLKVTLVFARYQGEKKISSVPYTLFLTANLNERTSLRMGNQVPVTTTVFGQGGGIPQSSYNYKDVGTNIDCVAQTAPDGYYRVTLTVQDSSVAYAEGDAAARNAPPTFRSFSSTFNILVRDGQTVQYTSAADPISGQVVKLDATVNVQK